MRVLTGPLVVVAVATLTAAVVAIVPESNAATGATERVLTQTVLLDGATEAAIDIRLDSGELWLAGGSMAAGMVVERTELVRGSFEHQNDGVPEITYVLTDDGREGRLLIEPPDSDSLWSWSPPEQSWHIFVNPTIPTRLSVHVGTGDAELVVGGMRLSELDVEAGAGNVTLDLTGDWRTNLEGQIEVGAGDITIRAPKDIGVKILAEQGVGNVRGTDFVARDGAYVNSAYGNTAYQIELQIEQGAGYIELSAS